MGRGIWALREWLGWERSDRFTTDLQAQIAIVSILEALFGTGVSFGETGLSDVESEVPIELRQVMRLNSESLESLLTNPIRGSHSPQPTAGL